MTIIQPNRRRGRVSMKALLGVLLFITMAIIGVLFYNRNVDLRYGVDETRIQISQLKSDNAELKDALYEKLDFADTDELVSRLHLVKDGSPDYFLALQ